MQAAPMSNLKGSALKRQVEALLQSIDAALDDPVGQGASAPSSASPPPAASEAGVAAQKDMRSLATPALAAPAGELPPSLATASPFSLGSGSPFARTSPFGAGSPFATSFARASNSLVPFGAAAVPAMPTADEPAATERLSFTDVEVEAQGDGEAKRADMCQPHSRDEFLQRLSTFRTAHRWFAKPGELAPPQCARHGWLLEARNQLACSVCGAKITAPESFTAPSAVAAVVTLLSSAHRPLCAWRDNPSPLSFCALLLPGRLGAPPSLAGGVNASREALVARFNGMLLLHALPKLSCAFTSQLERCAAVVGKQDVAALHAGLLALLAPSASFALGEVEMDRRRTAGVLALLGWRASRKRLVAGGGAVEAIECSEDARTVGLWQYEPLHQVSHALAVSLVQHGSSSPASHAERRLVIVADGKEAHSPSPLRKRSREVAESTPPSAERAGAERAGSRPLAKRALRPLDPVAEHSLWSPWLAVADGDSVPAWMRCAQLLLSPAHCTQPARPPTHQAISAMLALV
uniref:C3HC-type domain-containing protein n=1 Tax=Calcidiscus leptoporus TaxID=127549 RepID=A0A7S0ITK8_9EUKA